MWPAKGRSSMSPAEDALLLLHEVARLEQAIGAAKRSEVEG